MEIARAADRRSGPSTMDGGLGRLLVDLGTAAGHGDQLRLTGPAGEAARAHFRHHTCEAGAEALLLLRSASNRAEDAGATNLQVAERVAQTLTLPARRSDGVGDVPPAGHAAAAVGAALVAIGRDLPEIVRAGSSAGLEPVLESVVAHAIIGVARTT